MTIRRYSKSDEINVINLLRLNTPKYFEKSEENDLIEYLQQEIEDYYVMEVDNQIIGAGGINYFLEEKTARISWDILHPNFQGKGYGRELVEFRKKILIQNIKVEIILVRTSQFVFEFYQKMGFTLVKITPDFWAKGYHLYEMKIKKT